MNFSLEQLATFVAVYEQKSLSKAAVKLNKHRSTIGQVVTNLEDTLQVTLFVKVGRSVEPTEEATSLYRYAKQAVEQLKTFDKLAMNLASGDLESINIGYCSFVPQIAIADIRMQLAKDFPNLRVNLFVCGKDKIKQGIESGDLHFGIVNVYDSTAINSFNSTYLETLSFIPFGARNSELSRTPPEEMLVKLKSTKQLVLQSLIEEGMSDKVILSPNYEAIDQHSVVIRLVELGHGWALLPRSVIKSEYVNQNLIQLEVSEWKKSLEVPISLWSPHSIKLEKIRESILGALQEYIDYVLEELNS
ncbi:LysR family transcriptional regulator [Vibrio sp. Sgm 22]|uniref:LysR family transcriptional regulator n=1 Tax=unclassified Vibrio TaxID=2614977 RepID=UPI002248B580|nr:MULTISPECIES: LysR family transcriptional regulator [unclassified Vibrio]MCX2760467.1 LysR family transcriptional regulator [Vibrio sp. 14G-20]MCX2777489.1 LysR family transcriptional regulator [Vibrio sp. Sgm 22]